MALQNNKIYKTNTMLIIVNNLTPKRKKEVKENLIHRIEVNTKNPSFQHITKIQNTPNIL